MTNLQITLQPKQRTAFDLSLYTKVLGYGGAKGGGKSYLVRARELFRRLKYPYSTGAIVRKTYGELWDNHIRQFFLEYPETKKWYSSERKAITYPNGSVTQFIFVTNEKDALNYQGRAFDDISIDEATQHQYETFRLLRSCNRLSNPVKQRDISPSMVLTFNPGGEGHDWVKRIFIDRCFLEEEGERSTDFSFVQAFLSDNKILDEADPEYRKNLENLPEHLRRAYLDGDWNIFAGVCFTELSAKNHIVDPFILPERTNFFAGYDWGYTHPFAFVLFAITPDGKWYVIDYFSAKGLLTTEHAQKIIECLDRSSKIYTGKIPPITMYAGTDIWNATGNKSTRYEELRDSLASRVSVISADTNREQGVSEIHSKLANVDSVPTLRFFRHCEPVFSVVRRMQIDPRRPEDVVKVDADEMGRNGDDVYDAFRYGVLTRNRAKMTPHIVQENTGEMLINRIMKRNTYDDFT